LQASLIIDRGTIGVPEDTFSQVFNHDIIRRPESFVLKYLAWDSLSCSSAETNALNSRAFERTICFPAGALFSQTFSQTRTIVQFGDKSHSSIGFDTLPTLEKRRVPSQLGTSQQFPRARHAKGYLYHLTNDPTFSSPSLFTSLFVLCALHIAQFCTHTWSSSLPWLFLPLLLNHSRETCGVFLRATSFDRIK
jgi:hypothetical protein